MWRQIGLLCRYKVLNSLPVPRSEDGSAGGGQGEECRAVRASKPRRLFVRTEASREVFFSLIEKNFRGRAKGKIVKKTSLLDTRAKRAAAGRERTIWFRATTRAARGQSGFCSKKVRISSNRHHQESCPSGQFFVFS